MGLLKRHHQDHFTTLYQTVANPTNKFYFCLSALPSETFPFTVLFLAVLVRMIHSCFLPRTSRGLWSPASCPCPQRDFLWLKEDPLSWRIQRYLILNKHPFRWPMCCVYCSAVNQSFFFLLFLRSTSCAWRSCASPQMMTALSPAPTVSSAW